MNSRRTFPVLVTRPATVAAVAFTLALAGCSARKQPATPVEPVVVGQVEVVGTLTAVKDGRPVDGGIDLTLETAIGRRELVRVPSAFIAGPRDGVIAMQAVMDAAKIGDRLRARGTRDESGAIHPETLERMP